MVRERVELLAREARDAVVLVARGVGEPAQRGGIVHAQRGGEARLGVLGAERHLDQRVLRAQRGDGGTTALRIRRAARDVGANGVGAGVGLEPCARARRIGRGRECRAERHRERGTDAAVGLGLPRGGERVDVRGACGRSGAHLGRGIGGEELRERFGVGRQRRHTLHALRRVGVLVQRTEQVFGDHGEAGSRRGRAPSRRRTHDVT